MLDDGINKSRVVLVTDSWNGKEGCIGGKAKDNYISKVTGADGNTWKKYRVTVPDNLDKSNLTISLRQWQDAWDLTTASHSVYWDYIEGFMLRKYVFPEPTVIIETTNQPPAKHIINIDAKVTHVTDLDGDGKNELIVGTYKIDGYDYVKLYRFSNGDYKEIWSYAIPENGRWGGVTAITAGDVDNDGQKEIIVSTGQPSDTGGDRTLRIFKRKSGLDSWEVVYSYKLGERTEALAMAVGDADNDGKNELIVGMSWYARKILQFKYDGTKYVVSTVENTGSDVNSINIADVDGDGKNEIVAGTSCWSAYDVRVLKWDGSSYKKIWRKYLGWTEARVGDLDGDGKNEILTVSGCRCGGATTPQPTARVFKYEGGEFKEIWRTDLATTGDYSNRPEPFIGNLVGSNIPEFAFKVRSPDKTTVKIFGFDKSRGEFSQIMEIEFNSNFGDMRLFIGDSDNNGVNELIVSGLHDGKLRIYEFVAESEIYDIKISNIDYPKTVSVNQTFEIAVTFNYNFTSPNDAMIQVYEHAGPLLAQKIEKLSGAGSKTYNFTLTAPSTPKIWQLNIHAFYRGTGPGGWNQTDIKTIYINISSKISTVSFNPSQINIPLNSTNTINITLDSAPNGLSGYNISISLCNGSVAEITSIKFPAWATLHSNSSLPADSLWIKAADLNDKIKSGAKNITLATITLRGDKQGESDILITVTKMDDDNGNPIDPNTVSGKIEVIGVVPFPGCENPPTDPDRDGLYEDINGNGRKDFNDVVVFFNYLEWVEENQPCIECFDFNKNGRIDFDDVVKLFEEI